MKAEDVLWAGGGFKAVVLDAPPAKLVEPEYSPLVAEDCFSFSCLFSHWIIWALLSKLLRDSSSLVLSAVFRFFDSVKSFSSFYLSMLSSLIVLYLSVISFTFCYSWSSYFLMIVSLLVRFCCVWVFKASICFL